MVYNPNVYENSILFHEIETTGLSDYFFGVFDEIVAMLPVVIPVMVSFLALRKGISFVRGILHSA